MKARAVVAKAQDALARATAAALAGAEGGGGGGEGGGGELSQAEAGRPHISSPELEREIEVEEAEEAVEAAEAAQEEAEHGGRAPQRLRRQFLNRAVWLQYRPQGNELVHIIPPEGRWPQENELVHIIPPEGRWPQGNELVHIIPGGGRWREDCADDHTDNARSPGGRVRRADPASSSPGNIAARSANLPACRAA